VRTGARYGVHDEQAAASTWTGEDLELLQLHSGCARSSVCVFLTLCHAGTRHGAQSSAHHDKAQARAARVYKGVVDSHNLHVVASQRGAQHQASDPSESCKRSAGRARVRRA